MSNERISVSSQENHQRSAELRGGAAHAHAVAAETRDKQDHPSANEQSRLGRELSDEAQARMEEAANSAARAGELPHFGHKEIEALAHSLWEARSGREGGEGEGSAEEDWFQASRQLRSRFENFSR